MEETLGDEIREAIPTPNISTGELNQDNFMNKEPETVEELIARQKKDQRDMQARTMALKKTATRGDKKKKKEVIVEIETLESDMKNRHAKELKELEEKLGMLTIPSTKDDPTLDNISQLTKLIAEEQPLGPQSTPATTDAHVKIEGKKVNKAKARHAKKQARLQLMRDQAEEETAGQVDMAKVENESIIELVKPMGLCLKDIYPDGHCLYNAIADQLKTRQNISKSYQEVRHDTALYMREHPAEFIPFFSKDDGEPYSSEEFRNYCDKIENTAEWGGQVEIMALSKAYQVPIYIIQAGSPILKVGEDEYPEKPPMKISYHRYMYALGAHYNSLRDA